MTAAAAARSRCSASSRWPRCIALAVVTASRDAAAQACCAGGSVVAPTRLATYEDFAIGLQTRAQGAMGSFGADGRYLPSQASSEQTFEQQLLASVRFARAAQAGVVLRALSTHRNAAGIDEWGGGLGDVTLTARYDFILPAERPRMPGLAVLAAATLPTGTPRRPRHAAAGDRRDRRGQLRRVAGAERREGGQPRVRHARAVGDAARRPHRVAARARRR